MVDLWGVCVCVCVDPRGMMKNLWSSKVAPCYELASTYMCLRIHGMHIPFAHDHHLDF